eukprot:6202195-Pleurochrysis_carterae.AAC.4
MRQEFNFADVENDSIVFEHRQTACAGRAHMRPFDKQRTNKRYKRALGVKGRGRTQKIFMKPPSISAFKRAHVWISPALAETPHGLRLHAKAMANRRHSGTSEEINYSVQHADTVCACE